MNKRPAIRRAMLAMRRPLGRAGGINFALAALFVVAWLLYPKVYVFSDQAYYLIRAYGLGRMADWSMDFYFAHRFGLLLPHWLSYQLFGVSHAASFLPQLGFLLILLFAVLSLCERPLQKVCAALVLLPLLPYTADARPDLGVACFMFLALVCMDKRNGERAALFGALFSLAAFYAFLIKTIAYFLLLPYLVVFALDALKRPLAWRFYFASVGTGIVLLSIYLLFYHIVYGDALLRLNAINERSAVFEWTIHGLGAYLHRFFIQPLTALPALFGIAFLLALARSVIVLVKGGPQTLVAIYFISGLLFVNFTPTSLADWQPLPLYWEGGRYLIFLAPAVAVLAAQLVGDLFASGHRAERFTVPAVAAVLALAIAHHSALKLKGSIHPAALAIEEARQTAMRGLVENDNATLTLSTGRNHHSFLLYAGFDKALHARIRLCDTAPIRANDGNAIVFIDKKQSAFVTGVRGEPNCDAELIQLTKAAGHVAMIDDERIYLSFPRRQAATP